jgi:hypothetical protein
MENVASPFVSLGDSPRRANENDPKNRLSNHVSGPVITTGNKIAE